MRGLSVALGVALMAGAAAAAAPHKAAAPLDAPIAPRVDTIGSEIRRGSDAQVTCDTKAGFGAIDAYKSCIDATQADNRQSMRTGYEAFDTGLYLAAFAHFQIMEGVAKENNVVGEPSEFAESERYYWTWFNTTRNKLKGLTAEAAASAAGLRPEAAEELIKQARNRWSDTPQSR